MIAEIASVASKAVESSEISEIAKADSSFKDCGTSKEIGKIYDERPYDGNKELNSKSLMEKVYQNLLEKYSAETDVLEKQSILEKIDLIESQLKSTASDVVDTADPRIGEELFQSDIIETSDNEEPLSHNDSSDVSGKKDTNELTYRYLNCKNESLEGDVHPITGVEFEKKTIEYNGERIEGVFANFDSYFDAQIPENAYLKSDTYQFKRCNEQLKAAIENDPDLKSKFTENQLKEIEAGKTPDKYTWHHNEQPGKMQLVETEVHKNTGHTGGRVVWGGGSEHR